MAWDLEEIQSTSEGQESLAGLYLERSTSPRKSTQIQVSLWTISVIGLGMCPHGAGHLYAVLSASAISTVKTSYFQRHRDFKIENTGIPSDATASVWNAKAMPQRERDHLQGGNRAKSLGFSN